jgi:hypothetical protein
MQTMFPYYDQSRLLNKSITASLPPYSGRLAPGELHLSYQNPHMANQQPQPQHMHPGYHNHNHGQHGNGLRSNEHSNMIQFLVMRHHQDEAMRQYQHFMLQQTLPGNIEKRDDFAGSLSDQAPFYAHAPAPNLDPAAHAIAMQHADDSTGSVNDSGDSATYVEKNPKVKAKKQDNKWLANFEKLKVYSENHGDCLVPRGYSRDPRLASWVAEQVGRLPRTKGQD